MLYELSRFGHFIGLMLISAGLIGVFIFDVRTRQARTLPVFAEAVRAIGIFYDGLVVPGAILLLASGTVLIVYFHDGWSFLEQPWLVGMIALFLFEFVEGNTITRVYFMKLGRLTREAEKLGHFTPEIDAVRQEKVPTFTHFLDLPIVFLIVSLGALRPASWTHFSVGLIAAIVVATTLTIILPRLFRSRSGGPLPGSS